MQPSQFLEQAVVPLALDRLRDVCTLVREANANLLRSLPRDVVMAVAHHQSANLSSNWSKRRAMHRALVLESHILYTHNSFDALALKEICGRGVLVGEGGDRKDSGNESKTLGISIATANVEGKDDIQTIARDLLNEMLRSPSAKQKERKEGSAAGNAGAKTDQPFEIKRRIKACRERLKAFVQIDGAILVRWAAHAVSWHLCANRLHSHFGHAGKTFLAIERALQLQQENRTPPRLGTLVSAQKMTLWIIDSLEARVNLAVGHGCLADEVFLAPGGRSTLLAKSSFASKQMGFSKEAELESRAFFVKNRKVCVDWFSRLRPRLLLAAATSGAFALGVWHARRYLGELAQQLWSIVSLDNSDSIPTVPHTGPDVRRMDRMQTTTAEMSGAMSTLTLCVKHGHIDMNILTGVEAWQRTSCFTRKGIGSTFARPQSTGPTQPHWNGSASRSCTQTKTRP